MATSIGGRDPGFRSALHLFAAELPRARGTDRLQLVRQLRRLAIASELHSAAQVVDALAEAIAREEGSALLASWLSAIDQAAAFGANDQDVAPLLLATVGVRYAH